MLRLYVRIRKFVRPIRLGQTPQGFLLGAMLVFCWQVAQSVAGTISSSGFSENDFFRLEWDYDLANGTGQIRLSVNDDGLADFVLRRFSSGEPQDVSIFMRKLKFSTEGVPLDSIALGSSDPFGDPTSIVLSGVPIRYDYEAPNPNLSAFEPLFLLTSNQSGSSQAVIDVTFPTENIALMETTMRYGGTLSAGVLDGDPPFASAFDVKGFFGDLPSFGLPNISNEDEVAFVSIQQIPEPSTVALLGAGAAGMGLRGRMRRFCERLLKPLMKK